MRAPRIRRAPAGARALGGGGTLTLTPVFSGHLSGTALGTIRIWVTPGGVRRLDFSSGPDVARPGERRETANPPPHLAGTLDAVRAYLAGERREFDVPLDLDAVTDFQRAVYERLLEIPFGRVVTYGSVADDLRGGGASARAVGQAVGANPVPILVPCHRVVGTGGRLNGYAAGLERKAALLRLEGIDVDGARPSSKVHPEVLRLPL